MYMAINSDQIWHGIVGRVCGPTWRIKHGKELIFTMVCVLGVSSFCLNKREKYAVIKFTFKIFLSQGRRRKKPFIDKKNAVTFHLVHRSQKDPLQADEESSKHVLLPVNFGNQVCKVHASSFCMCRNYAR